MRVHVGRLIGGFICLAAALLLAVLNVVLPAGKVVFMVGDTNAPMVAAVGLALLGLWRLIAAWRR